MEFDEKEIFESFENEFNRKEKSKRPGNRFPTWIVPILIILAGAAYYGFSSDRFSGVLSPTADVESLAVTAEATAEGIATETVSALMGEGIAAGTSGDPVVKPTPEEAVTESTNVVANVDWSEESFETSSESSGESLETPPTARTDTAEPQAAPTDVLPTATARPSIWERLTGLVRRHPTETAAPVEDSLPTVQSPIAPATPIEVSLPTVQSPIAPATPIEVSLPMVQSSIAPATPIEVSLPTVQPPIATATPIEVSLPTVQPSMGIENPLPEVETPTVTYTQSTGDAVQSAAQAEITAIFPDVSVIMDQPTTFPTAIPVSSTDAPVADNFVPVALDDKTAATATVFSAEPMPAVTQLNDEEVIVLGAPTQPVAASVMPMTVLNPVPSATITLELPATATLLPAPTETDVPTETPVPSETPFPTLTPTATEKPGFFKRVGAFFFGDDATATPTPTLDPAVSFEPTATEKPGFFKRVGAFFFGDDATATPTPTLDPAASFKPTATPKPGFFAPVVSFFFPPTDTPVPSATDVFDAAEDPAEPTPIVLTVEVAINSGVDRETLTSKDGSKPISDFDDEPVFQDGEPFYLPTSDISNPPTLMPPAGQEGQVSPAVTSRPLATNTVGAPNIGLPLVTQAIPTQPSVRAPAQPTHTVVVNPQFAPPNPAAGRDLPAAAFSQTADPASRGSASGDGIIGYEPNGAPIYAPGHGPQSLPTALPNTGVGNNGALPRYGALFALLLAVIGGSRYLRSRNAKK